MRTIHWPSFWRGAVEGFAILPAAFMAAAAVFRRTLIKGDCDVFFDVRSLWWSHEESLARNRRALDRLLDEWQSSTSRPSIEQETGG